MYVCLYAFAFKIFIRANKSIGGHKIIPFVYPSNYDPLTCEYNDINHFVYVYFDDSLEKCLPFRQRMKKKTTIEFSIADQLEKSSWLIWMKWFFEFEQCPVSKNYLLYDIASHTIGKISSGFT